MGQNVNITVNFAGLKLATPVVTASGTSGYADELTEFMDFSKLGALTTKSISVKPRKGNPTPRIVETNAGMLNAIGLANMGLEQFLEEKIPILEALNTKVFVNLAGQTIDEYVAVARQLAQEEAVDGFELNISCPNVKKGGISFGTDPTLIREITAAVKGICENKPLMVKLTPTVTDIGITAKAAVDAGADALSLVNTFTAMVIDIDTQKPVLANRTGGLSGPAIKPMAVYLVNKVYNEVAKDAGIPILGMGGIRNATDAMEFIIAGATAVAIGTANFVYPDTAEKVASGLRDYCQNKGISDIRELIGCLH
ncbi:MAG: dihydroorotate dehydrogenase B catalytic subunit [Planctomycetales bacterium 4572_13]|nr:MAG: dihydroorotate dehydrogenase B catalytic subunit [Planctomycetales bacterium 4572_13]